MARPFEAAMRRSLARKADSGWMPGDDRATKPPPGNFTRDRKGRLVRVKNPPGTMAGGANAQPPTSPANPRAPVAASTARSGNTLLEVLARKAGL